jgi:hypothetical protein
VVIVLIKEEEFVFGVGAKFDEFFDIGEIVEHDKIKVFELEDVGVSADDNF